MIYAVQARSMHTAIHNLFIYATRRHAVNALNQMYPEGLQPTDKHCLKQIEINFRHPPTTWHGENLTIVNGMWGTRCGVPDFY